MSFPDLIFAALALGCCYGLLAMGYALLYNLCHIFLFAHGDLLMVGGYLGLLLLRLRFPFFLVLPLVALLCALLCLLADRLVYAPVSQKAPVSTFLLGIGLSFLMQAAVLFFFGATPVSYPAFLTGKNVALFNLRLPYGQVLLLLFAPAVLLLLTLLYQKSVRFLAIRALADDPVGGEACGISKQRAGAVVFLISGALAGCSGVLYGCCFVLSPAAGTLLGLRAFTAAMLGGTGRPCSAFLGGLILGLAETILPFFFPSVFLDCFFFLFLLLLLICTGRRDRQRIG